MSRHLHIAAALGLLLTSAGCAFNADSREDLAEIGLNAIQSNDASHYRDLLVTLPKLREHCTETELHRAMLVIPQANMRLESSIESCHEMANWDQAVLVSIRGGDVYEHALECRGHFARMSSVVATYVIGFDRYEVHHRRGYIKDGDTFLVSREPWCARQ